MDVSTDLIYDAKRKMLAKYPRFGSEIAVANIEFTATTYHIILQQLMEKMYMLILNILKV